MRCPRSNKTQCIPSGEGKPMKHLFVVNPAAGGSDQTAEVARKVREAFQYRADENEIYVTRAPMDAAEKIKREAENCAHLRVYACGGDGTFNECVCGAALRENVAVCPFPIGTGNDFCRMFGEEQNLFLDLEALLEGTEHPMDLIDCNGRFCANICSVGIDARIGGDVHKYSHLPLLGGSRAYLTSTVVNVLKGVNQPMKLRIGDYTAEGQHALLCACNGRFYGGGFNPSRTARPDDGMLDIYVVKRVSLFTLARLIGHYAAGEGEKYPKYIQYLRGDSIHAEFETDMVINLDGEIIRARSVDMRLRPQALRLIVPRGMRFFQGAAEML